MPKGIYAAASAMVTETRLLEATSRNIAHAQTPGYRREGALRVGFDAVLRQEGRNGGVAGDGGTGVLPNGSYFAFNDGARESTSNPYDVALQGDGFFAVRDPNGKTMLTRNGNFNLDSQGRLATREGHLALGQGGPITIPDGTQKVVIDATGRVFTETASTAGVVSTFIDQLRVATVAKPQQMVAANGVYFDPAKQPLVDVFDGKSGAPQKGAVFQGALERGNINPIDELVQLVAMQRRYDAAQKALTEQSRTGDGYSDILRS
ncbi:MAG: flagellar hook basal-body protein [Planctomycetota bacterium]